MDQCFFVFHSITWPQHLATDPLEQYTIIDSVRGSEGDAARAYFGTFGSMVREDREAFTPHGRTRRPPLDRMNALLSFVYTLLRHDCAGALEGVGLDPQVGYLHTLRPGRPALALDLMEELRPILADRLVLSLINRRQVKRTDFVEREGGAVHLTDKGRKLYEDYRYKLGDTGTRHSASVNIDGESQRLDGPQSVLVTTSRLAQSISAAQFAGVGAAAGLVLNAWPTRTSVEV